MKIPKKVVSALKEEKNILIATHVNPDGDALGSSLALADALVTLDKEVQIYSRDKTPPLYKFLPGHRRITSRVAAAMKNDPLLVLLDCNSRERAALTGYVFRKSVVIDHHETENDFGDIRWIDRSAAATGLMIYFLIKALGIALTKDIATNLYTAVAVDTGTFRYSNTKSDVLRAGADLIESGAEPHRIADYLYETWDRNRFRLLAMALDTLHIHNGLATTYITKDMFRRTITGFEDTENFANFPRMIDSVKVSAIFREVESGMWKVSLRSKGSFNVAKIAEGFGGGGHRNAAGYRIRADLKSAKAALSRSYKKRL